MSNPPLPPIPPSMPPQGYPPPPPRSWWGRNWKWVVPVGCLTPILICGGLLTLALGIGFTAIKSSEPYTDSLGSTRANAQVQALLGTPIEPAMMVFGEINLDNNAGNVDMYYTVSGPKGEGQVFVVGMKAAGAWTYETMHFKDASGQFVDLMAVEAPAPQ